MRTQAFYTVLIFSCFRLGVWHCAAQIYSSLPAWTELPACLKSMCRYYIPPILYLTFQQTGVKKLQTLHVSATQGAVFPKTTLRSSIFYNALVFLTKQNKVIYTHISYLSYDV